MKQLQIVPGEFSPCPHLRAGPCRTYLARASGVSPPHHGHCIVAGAVVVVVAVLAALADCMMESDPRCRLLCDELSGPVCGWNRRGDWRTFSTECALVNYNCDHEIGKE